MKDFDKLDQEEKEKEIVIYSYFCRLFSYDIYNAREPVVLTKDNREETNKPVFSLILSLVKVSLEGRTDKRYVLILGNLRLLFNKDK